MVQKIRLKRLKTRCRRTRKHDVAYQLAVMCWFFSLQHDEKSKAPHQSTKRQIVSRMMWSGDTRKSEPKDANDKCSYFNFLTDNQMHTKRIEKFRAIVRNRFRINPSIGPTKIPLRVMHFCSEFETQTEEMSYEKKNKT